MRALEVSIPASISSAPVGWGTGLRALGEGSGGPDPAAPGSPMGLENLH